MNVKRHMTAIEHESITHLTNRRPHAALVTLDLADGRRVEGVGKSYLTWRRAESQAMESAKWAADETAFSYEITKAEVGHGHVVNFVGDEFRVHHKRIPLPPHHKVGIRATKSDRTYDASGSSFLRFNRAFSDALTSAQSRFDRR